MFASALRKDYGGCCTGMPQLTWQGSCRTEDALNSLGYSNQLRIADDAF